MKGPSTTESHQVTGSQVNATFDRYLADTARHRCGDHSQDAFGRIFGGEPDGFSPCCHRIACRSGVELKFSTSELMPEPSEHHVLISARSCFATALVTNYTRL